jgi:hypothetical protein
MLFEGALLIELIEATRKISCNLLSLVAISKIGKSPI